MLRQRLAGFELEQRHATSWMLDEAIEGAAKDHLRVGGPNGKRDLEQRLSFLKRGFEHRIVAECNVSVACPLYRGIGICKACGFFIPQQPPEFIIDRGGR